MLSPHVSAPSVIVAVCGAVVASATTAVAADAGKRAFNLPRGDAAATLKLFAAAAGTPIVYLVDRVRGTTTQAVSGEFTPREALERMLAGSVLEAEQDGATGAFIVSRKALKGEVGPVSNPQTQPRTAPMKSPRTLLAALAGWLALGNTTTQAQQTSTSPTATELIELSPFNVSTEKDVGYQAVDTLSGGRMAINLLANPGDVSALTRDFLDDIGALEMTDITPWLTSAVQTDNSGDRDFGNSLSIRGLSVATNLRNYFRYDTSIDGYIMERVEGSRGPNAIMYGESNAGGAVGITTKQAKFRNFGSVDVRTDSNGSIYSAIDVNQKLNDRLALRAAAFYSDRELWYDRGSNKRRGAFLTGTYNPWKNATLRVDLERTNGLATTFRTFTDQSSNWDGTTTVSAALAANPAATSGLSARLNNNFGVVIIPATGKSYNFQNFAQTTGSGLTLNFNDPRPDGRTPFPRLPSRGYQIRPADQLADQETSYYSAVFDQQIIAGLNLQLAADASSVQRDVMTRDIGGNAVRTDVSRNLPDGTPNANFGKQYFEARLEQSLSDQWQQNYRATLSYDLKLGRNSQLFSVNLLRRDGTFDVVQEREGRTNGTLPAKNNGANSILYRFYLDQPGLSVPNRTTVDGTEIGRWLNRDSLNLSTLDSLVLATIGTYFDRKLTVLAGLREDEASTNQRSHVDYTPTGDINSYRYFEKSRKQKSSSAGFTYFPIKPLGLYANYAEGFLPIQNESWWVGSRGEVSFTVAESKSLGLRFNLKDSFLVGSLGYYTTDEGDRVVGVTKTEINRIWTNLSTSNPATLDNLIGGPFSSFNDTLDYFAEGFEADVVMNVTKQLRLMANIALPETKQDNANPDLIEYYNKNRAQWQAGLTDPLLSAAQKTQIQNDLNTILGYVNGAVNGRSINGTTKYRANLFANYSFRADQIRGLSIGAGVNMYGKQLIGNTPTDGFDYIYTDAYELFMVKVAYAFKYRRMPISLQLTANNLLDHKDPIFRNVSTVGGATYRNNYVYVDPRTINLNLNVKF